ncbi:MAG: NAD(+)/NADH kinase [Ruminococcus sp.]|nr:NAD(+)/NADH kinase [Ruminococcus sp.]
MKIIIFPNMKKPEAAETLVNTAEMLIKRGAEVFCPLGISGKINLPGVTFTDTNSLKADFIIAVGGDGTILKSCRKASADGTPLLGINTGRLGFMASAERTELHLLEKLFTGDFTIENRMMLKAEIFRDRDLIFSSAALNEITISTIYSKIADFEVSIDSGKVSSVRADGIVIATPTGSTAYALACGGPIVEPGCKSIQVTPLCPHSLFSRTMIFSDDREITVTCPRGSNDNTQIFVSTDGREQKPFYAKDYLKIKKSKETLRLIDIKGNTFFNAVNEKLMRSIK